MSLYSIVMNMFKAKKMNIGAYSYWTIEGIKVRVRKVAEGKWVIDDPRFKGKSRQAVAKEIKAMRAAKTKIKRRPSLTAKAKPKKKTKPKAKPKKKVAKKTTTKKKTKSTKTTRTISDQKGGERLSDIGEHIGGSKKDIAAAAKAYDIAKLKKIYSKFGYEDMTKIITKAKLLKKIDYDELKEKGVNGGVALLAKTLSIMIPPKPKPTKYSKDEDFIKDYLDVMQYANKILDPDKFSKFKTLEEYLSFIKTNIQNRDKNDGMISSRSPLKKLFFALRRVDDDSGQYINYQAKRHDNFAQEGNHEKAWSWFKSRKGIERKKGTRFVRATTATIERVGPKIKKTPPKALLKDLGLRGVEYGNYLTTKEQQHHAQATYEAFSDLADVMGIKPKSIGQTKAAKKALAMAFGARGTGTAAAHYETAKKVINITRKSGGGSLAHEYGHFIDNILGDINVDIPFNYITDIRMMKDIAKMPKELGEAYMEFLHTAYRKKVYRTRRVSKQVDQQAAVNKIEPALEQLLGQTTSYSISGIWSNRSPKDAMLLANYVVGLANLAEKESTSNSSNLKIAAKIKKLQAKVGFDWESPLEQTQRTKRSLELVNKFKGYLKGGNPDFVQEITNYKKMVKTANKEYKNAKEKTITDKNLSTVQTDFIKQIAKMPKYWSEYKEVFARCFEVWVNDKLESKKRKNSYLTHGTRYSDYDRYKPNEKGIYEGFPYPIGEERKNIVKAMTKFIKAAIKTKSIQKAFNIQSEDNV